MRPGKAHIPGRDSEPFSIHGFGRQAATTTMAKNDTVAWPSGYLVYLIMPSYPELAEELNIFVVKRGWSEADKGSVSYDLYWHGESLSQMATGDETGAFPGSRHHQPPG